MNKNMDGEVDVEPKETQVDTCIHELNYEVSMAYEISSKVLDRLTPVLRNAETCEEPKQDFPPLVPLADTVRDITIRLRRVNSNYKDVLARLEL